MNQTYSDLQVILVNDGSTDKSSIICDEWEKKDSRVEVIRKKNGGLVSARKAGLEIARGEFVAYVDGDDWIENDWIEKLHEVIMKDASDIVCAGFIKEFDNGARQRFHDNTPNGRYDKSGMSQIIWPRMISEGRQFASGVAPEVWNKLFRRKLLAKHQNNVFDTITIGEDAACIYPYLMDANSVSIANNVAGYHYRINNSSMSRSGDKKYVYHIEQLFKCLDTNMNKYSFECINNQMLQYFAYMLLQDGIANANRLSATKWCVPFILNSYYRELTENVFLNKKISDLCENPTQIERWQLVVVKAINKKKYLWSIIKSIKRDK